MSRNRELDAAYEEMGRVNENKYKPIIQATYGKVMKANFKYSKIDFYGESYMLELKSRDMSSTDFKETMIGYNKVEEGFKTLDHYKHHIPQYKVYFAFGFTDGLFIWELNRENYDINGGDTKKRIGGTSNRGWEDYKDHYYIDVKNLIKISDLGCWVHQKVRENTLKRIESKKTYKSSIPDGVCLLKLPKTI